MENYKSPLDNRVLPNFPIANNIKVDFPTSADEYVNTRIGFRDNMINLYTRLNDYVFDYMVHPSYMYGKDGYIFQKITREDEDFAFLDDFVSLLSKIQMYCTERDIPFLYVFNPSKATVYPEKLPNGVNHSNKKLEYFLKLLNENDIKYVNNTDVLIEEKKTQQVYNVKYDAGHWNDLGAFYGTNNTLKQINTYFPAVNQNELSDFDIQMEKKETLTVSDFPIEEEVPSFKSKQGVKRVHDYDTELIRNSVYNEFYYSINNELSMESPKVMVFQGSYLNTRLQYFQNQFREYIAIHDCYCLR